MPNSTALGSAKARLGVEFHSSAKWKSVLTLGVSLFTLMASCIVILSEPTSISETFLAHPAWFFSGGIFLLFALILGFQAWRVLSADFILEFTEKGISDRSRLRERFVPYDAIEIFSPPLENLFKSEASVAELRAELGLEDFFSVSCRLKVGHFSEAAGDFVFSERVAPSEPEMQTLIVERLRLNVAKFEFLFADFGDDGDDGDETNA